MALGHKGDETEGRLGRVPGMSSGTLGHGRGVPLVPKVDPLRGWEFKLATGKGLRTEEDSEGPWGGWGEQREPSPEQRASIYGGIRTAAEILPYTRYLFPSGRDEWSKKSTWGQTKELGIEVLSLLPPVLIGKGLKILAKAPVKVGTFPFKVTKKIRLKKQVGKLMEQDPFLDIALKDIPKYERISAGDKAIKKWGLTPDEASQLMEGKPWVWESLGRSGARGISRGSEGFQKLFTKAGVPKKRVTNQLKQWAKPHDQQELAHYTAEWHKQIARVFGKKYDPKSVFRAQAVKLFGEVDGKAMQLGEVGSKEMGIFIRDLLVERPADLIKRMDIGYGHWQPYHTIPARKVFGYGNKVWSTFDRIYVPVRDMFGRANQYATLMTSRFHSLLASRGLGKLIDKGQGVTVLGKRTFSKREWEEAGELVTKMDDAVGAGMKQEEIQAFFQNASENAQKIAKSWHDFTDSLYVDYVKSKIPQIFEEIGLTGRGRDALRILMDSPKGIAKVMDAAFSQSANLAYADKAKIVDAMLERAREMFKGKNIDYFTNKPVRAMGKKERAFLGEKIKNAMRELSPMTKGNKKGFVNYLENYTTRIRDKQIAQSSDRFTRLAKKRKAGFTKGRVLEVAAEGRVTDLTRIAEARINMQAKDLYVYRQLEDVIGFAERLPEKYRNYSEHYIARQLGEASNADVALAQWVSATLGRVTGKIYDERSVAQFAHTINNLVYMGGLGFKPFSAMRNYFQPLLMVPADMGGIKDMYWLGHGYRKAFQQDTRAYIQSIGAIQEFAPDLYLKPRVTGFGGKVKIAGREVDLPSTQAVRDVSLWLFKQSDRHNRYVTGGAAIAKWDYMVKKHLSKGLDKKAVKQFSKKLNVASRDEWIRAQINESLRMGTAEGLEQAKKLWVYDVIADTQYLYGTLDAPIYGQSAGSLGKMAGIFQSWWMNYGSALEKWIRSPGKVPLVNGRTMTWLLAGAIVEETASGLWPKTTVRKMVHLGPFPTMLNEFMIPPTFAPVYYTARTIADGLDAIKYQEPDQFKRSFSRLLKSLTMFTPGGLQIAQMKRAAESGEGFEGFLKGIVRYDPEEEEY